MNPSSMNTSGHFQHSKPTVSGNTKRQLAKGWRDRVPIDLWLDLLDTMPPTPGGLDVDVLAEYLEVSETSVWKYQSSATTKMRSAATSRGLTVNDVRRGLELMGVTL